MAPHQQRVVDEKAELDERATKLSEFIGTNPVFESLDLAEQERMKEQCEIMWQYSEILAERLKAMGIDLRDELIEAATTHCPARAVALIGELQRKTLATYRQAVQEIVANVQ